MESAAQSAGLSELPPITELDTERRLHAISGLLIEELWRDAEADSLDLTPRELSQVLLDIGAKFNYGLPAGEQAGRAQAGAFCQSLQLKDLALAHACALGRDAAWRRFIATYRESLIQAAAGITGSSERGKELADSLYTELFGVNDRGAQQRSPLSYYSGRGSLKGFLRATLAQRNVDSHRRASREAPLTSEAVAPCPVPAAAPSILRGLRESLKVTLSALPPEDRFLLSAWFLDQCTLLDIARVLGVHEATASRRVKRLTLNLHSELLRNLEASGLSRAASEEALGADPRDVDINLRTLLQPLQTDTFLKQERPAEPKQT